MIQLLETVGHYVMKVIVDKSCLDYFNLLNLVG